MNQARFRYSNERLRRTAAHIRFEPSDRVPFVCECPDRDCFEVLMLSLEEYDRLRTHPSWFLFAAGHEDDESAQERIVEVERAYAIVEKIAPGQKRRASTSDTTTAAASPIYNRAHGARG